MTTPSYFLLAYAIGAFLGALFGSYFRELRSTWRLLLYLLALVVFCVACISLSERDKNVPTYLLGEMLALRRPVLAWQFGAACCGVAIGLALTAKFERSWRRVSCHTCYLGSILGISLLVLQPVISPWLPDPSASTSSGMFLERSAVDGFRVELLTKLAIAPTAITLGPEGNLYVAGYTGIAFQNGAVVRLDPNSAAPKEETVARYLNRPHGISSHGGDLYVSRSGQYSRAVDGVIIQEDTGAVTRLRDLDGDGVIDHYSDVVSGLPGAHLPDGLHTNNGIAFDDEGHLYITVGTRADVGPAVHQYAGTILRVDADGGNPVIVARGLRNPYGVVIGPDGELFCTDNDANDGGNGDEINHIVEGGHYGDPYTSRDAVSVSNLIEPLLYLRSAQGIAYAPPGSLRPGYDACLYVASYGDNHVNRIRLEREGDRYKATAEFFARVPSPIALVVDGESLYVCSHHENSLYRITPED